MSEPEPTGKDIVINSGENEIHLPANFLGVDKLRLARSAGITRDKNALELGRDALEDDLIAVSSLTYGMPDPDKYPKVVQSMIRGGILAHQLIQDSVNSLEETNNAHFAQIRSLDKGANAGRKEFNDTRRELRSAHTRSLHPETPADVTKFETLLETILDTSGLGKFVDTAVNHIHKEVIRDGGETNLSEARYGAALIALGVANPE